MRRGWGWSGCAGRRASLWAALCALIVGLASGQSDETCPQFFEISQVKVTAAGCDNSISVDFSMLSNVYASTNIAILGVSGLRWFLGRVGGHVDCVFVPCQALLCLP